MNNNLLYITGTLVDLPPSFEFATSIKKADMANLSFRGVTYTNSVKLQWTPTNQILFGFAFNDKSSTAVPYSKLSCRLVQNGVEMISDGYCLVSSADESGVSITLFENMLDLIDYIGEKKINQLNYIAPAAWNAAGIDAARLNTAGIISAVLDWGWTSIYNVDRFLPCYFYAELIEAILGSTGLTLSGAILSNTDLTDLVIPYGLAKWEYPYSYGSPYAFKVSFNTADQVFNMVPGVNNYYQVLMDTDDDPVANSVWQGPAEIFDFTTSKGIVPDVNIPGAWLSASITGGVYIRVDNWNPGDTFRVRTRIDDANGTLVTQQFTVVDEVTYGASPTAFIQIDVAALAYVLTTGQRISLEVGRAASALPTIDVTIQFGNPPFNYLALDFPVAPNRTSVSWNQLLPDAKQRDVLRDFTVRFGVVYKQVLGVLHLKTINEILSDTSSAVDWTTKRVDNNGDGILFKSSAYGQTNLFKHDDAVEDEDLGAGSFAIPNDALEEQKVIFESIFSNALLTDVDGGNKGLIPVYDFSSAAIDEFINEPGLRVMTLRDKESGEGAITFNAIARSDYRVAYFQDVTQQKDTSFNYFLGQHYPLLVNALQKMKIKTHYYMLTETDVASYDPHKMIFDNGSYYLVNQIMNFIPGRPTKVELLKV